MRYSFDPHADALYIEVAEGAIDHQVEMADGVLVDVAADGRPVGIDVMGPSAGWAWQPIAERWKLGRADADLLESLAAVPSWRPDIGRWSAVARQTAGSPTQTTRSQLVA